MGGTISIQIDPPRYLIRMTLGGFFSLDDVERLDAERRRALAALNCGLNQHLTLCDVAACQLSTPDVVAALQRVIGNPLFRSKRCAMVVRGALARMQARRAVQRADVAMFDTRAAAEAWLFTADVEFTRLRAAS
ncbi:MAG: hypothetical protein C0500_00890 [Sphingobium sp.]|nr:hypothetical protein [Sphingobium sp.]